MPPRNATRAAESNTNVAPSCTSRAKKSRPGLRLQSPAKRESSPTRSSPQWNHRARRDTAIPLCRPPHRNRRAHARNMRGKRAPLPTANRTTRTRSDRTAGSKPETPCPDGRSMSPGPQAQPPHLYSAGPRPRRGSVAASRSKGSSATLCSSQLVPRPRCSWGKSQPPRQWAIISGPRLWESLPRWQG